MSGGHHILDTALGGQPADCSPHWCDGDVVLRAVRCCLELTRHLRVLARQRHAGIKAVEEGKQETPHSGAGNLAVCRGGVPGRGLQRSVFGVDLDQCDRALLLLHDSGFSGFARKAR